MDDQDFTTLRKLRAERNFTMTRLCELIGAERPTYRKLENGVPNPTTKLLKKLSKLYNIPIDNLLDNNVKELSSSALDLQNFERMLNSDRKLLSDFFEFLKLHKNGLKDFPTFDKRSVKL